MLNLNNFVAYFGEVVKVKFEGRGYQYPADNIWPITSELTGPAYPGNY